MININDIKIGQKVWYQEHWSQMIVWGKVTKITKFDNNEDFMHSINKDISKIKRLTPGGRELKCRYERKKTI